MGAVREAGLTGLQVDHEIGECSLVELDRFQSPGKRIVPLLGFFDALESVAIGGLKVLGRQEHPLEPMHRPADHG